MSALRRAAGDYLAMRRSLGYKLERQGPVLMDFIGYLEDAARPRSPSRPPSPGRSARPGPPGPGTSTG